MNLRAQDATQVEELATIITYMWKSPAFSLVSISVPLYYVNMVYLHPNGIYYTATTEPHTSFLSVM